MWTGPLAADDAGRGRGGRLFRRLAIAVVIVVCLPLAVVVGLWVWALHGITFPSAAEVTSQRVIALEAADGQALQPQGLLQLPPIPVEKMPAAVVNAVLSIEDRRFYDRGPIDPVSVLRALRDNLEAGHVVAGGSTITQQLVKVLYLSPERTYKRKVQEAALAIWIDRNLTKNQILTSYLNNVYLGSGATGFPAAAKLYFGKQVADLNLAEAAMLAGMINAPGKDDPLHNLLAARIRASAVLDAMVANGKIDQATALAAKLNPAAPNPAQLAPTPAGWFTDWVYRDAAAAIPRQAGAVTVRTTLDLRLQQLAANVVDSMLASEGAKVHATQAALVAMRPDGAVVAMVGGRDYADSQFNRATQAKRQPGSAFKLFDYYAALRHGYTPGDTVLDEPVDIKGWEAHDYARSYHGRVTLAAAFAHSYNAAAVRLAQQVGIPQVIAAAHDLGLHAKLANNPSLALGTSEVTLLDITGAYAAVRAGVAPLEPWAIDSVRLPNEQSATPIGRPHQPQHSLGPYQNELIQLLRGVVEHGTGRAAALPGFAAGKTGTAQDYRDAWFVGFNDSLVVGVWVGNDDHSPMRRVTGGSLPATIWKNFMEQASAVPAATAAAPQPNTNQTPPADAQQAQAPTGLFNQTIAGPASAKCNIPVCERNYRSFRASDCTYQPEEGGPRRFCDRGAAKIAGVSDGGERPAPKPPAPNPDNKKPDDQNAANDRAQATQPAGAASGKCNAAACQRYSSFRASDCTYQPYGGGPRRVCGRQDSRQDGRLNGRQDNRTASKSSRERNAPAAQAPVLDGRRAGAIAEPPDGDPRSSFFGPMFDLGGPRW